MLTQHSAALATLERGADGGGGKAAAVQHYHEAGHASTVPAAPYMPPHQQLAPAPGTTRAAGLIQCHTDVCKLLQAVAEDCRHVFGFLTAATTAAIWLLLAGCLHYNGNIPSALPPALFTSLPPPSASLPVMFAGLFV